MMSTTQGAKCEKDVSEKESRHNDRLPNVRKDFVSADNESKGKSVIETLVGKQS